MDDDKKMLEVLEHMVAAELALRQLLEDPDSKLDKRQLAIARTDQESAQLRLANSRGER